MPTRQQTSCKCWKNHNLSRSVHQEFLRGCQSLDDKRRRKITWVGPMCAWTFFGDLIVVTSKGRSRPDQPHRGLLGCCVYMEHMQIYGRGIKFYSCSAHQMKNSAMGEIIRIQFIFLGLVFTLAHYLFSELWKATNKSLSLIPRETDAETHNSSAPHFLE